MDIRDVQLSLCGRIWIVFSAHITKGNVEGIPVRIRRDDPNHSRICAGDRSTDGDCHCDGSAIPRIEVPAKSLDEYSHGRLPYPVRFLVTDWGYSFHFLWFFCSDRDCLHLVHYLVRMDVAQSRVPVLIAMPSKNLYSLNIE